MDKNDRLKEELAESRHNDVMGLMLGAFGFGALAVAIAYWGVAGVVEFIKVGSLIIVGFAWILIVACRSRRRRKDLIKQSDNQEDKQRCLNSK